jgi:hypothetical protein
MRGAGLVRRRATSVTAVTAALAVALSGTAWAAAGPRPGAAGLGDAYYPSYGNGGYDVGHYKLDVAYDPASDLVTGTATITAKATQNLSRFDLDFGLRALSVTVDGQPASTRTNDLELVVTPREAVKKGASMTVVVVYAGVHPRQGGVELAREQADGHLPGLLRGGAVRHHPVQHRCRSTGDHRRRVQRRT